MIEDKKLLIKEEEWSVGSQKSNEQERVLVGCDNGDILVFFGHRKAHIYSLTKRNNVKKDSRVCILLKMIRAKG